MRAYERLLKYVTVNTTSHEEVEKTPSGEGEPALAHLLTEEMEAMAYKYGSEGIGMLKKVFTLIDRHTPTRSKEIVSSIKSAVLNDLKNE